jgi:hypothetical protein
MKLFRMARFGRIDTGETDFTQGEIPSPNVVNDKPAGADDDIGPSSKILCDPSGFLAGIEDRKVDGLVLSG